MPVSKSDFGEDFKWGVSVAAYQIEGAHEADGKAPSIWDVFTNEKGKIYKNQHGNIACDFYNKYQEDIDIIDHLSIPNFRFSIAWSRIFPEGIGKINQKGLDFYNRLIDSCLEKGIEPWVTLYHWDLPYALEQKGGWTNREVVHWFSEYATTCVKAFGDRVKYWMVLNEPMVFTGAGYFLGVHAPGRRGLSNFLPSIHHAVLCQAEGGRIIKSSYPNSEVGTTLSCSHIEPHNTKQRHIKAAEKVDALLNRLFIEPALGLGYPVDDIKLLNRLEKYMRPNDDQKMKFDFDFIGVQNYTREIVKHSYFTPYLKASIIKANKRKVPSTLMNWEIYPKSIYKMLKKYSKYDKVKKIYVTENGAAFYDTKSNDAIHDANRRNYIKEHIKQILKAKKEGVNVQGYFIWTLMDNFEWAEGYYPRFGIIYTDFKTQERIIKSSGYWYKSFLEN